MTHARSDLRRVAGRFAPAVAAVSIVLAPAALAAETGATRATATFTAPSCVGSKHSINLSVKNPSPSSATFTIRVDGPNIATPNSITVPALSSRGEEVSLPKDATNATVADSTGKVIGTSPIECSGKSSSSGASGASSAGAGSAAAADPSASSSEAADSAAAPAASSSSSSDGSRKMIGYGVVGLGVVLAAVLLFREFK